MDKNKNGKNNNKLLISSIILGIVVIFLAGIAIYFTMNNQDKDDKTLAYTDLIKEMSYGNIEKIEMTVGSTSVKVKMKNEDEEKKAVVPNTEAFIGLVQQKVAEGNEIELIQKPKSVITQISSTLFT